MAALEAAKKTAPISAAARDALWAFYKSAAPRWTEALPRPGADAALDETVAALGLTRSQCARQWGLFRKSARPAPRDHALSRHARRRAQIEPRVAFRRVERARS